MRLLLFAVLCLGFLTQPVQARVGLQSGNPDFDGSGVVDFPDFLIFVSAFGSRQGDERYEEQFDLDGDTEIGFGDFLIFAEQYGETVFPDEMRTIVALRGSTLYFRGDINVGSYQQFQKIISENGDAIDTLWINSPGGYTDEGKLMGHWIYDNTIDVVVDTLCFSSCANYIFTAARNKLIKKDALVGWHGSEQQDEYIAKAEGKTLDEYLRQVHASFADPEYRFETFKADVLKAAADERAFLKKIGVNADVMLYGLLPANYARYISGDYSGWTFSIEDMSRFGINNVSHEGGGAYPSEQAKKIFSDILIFSVTQ